MGKKGTPHRKWSKEEKLNYGSTPMFMINGRKGDSKVYA